MAGAADIGRSDPPALKNGGETRNWTSTIRRARPSRERRGDSASLSSPSKLLARRADPVEARAAKAARRRPPAAGAETKPARISDAGNESAFSPKSESILQRRRRFPRRRGWLANGAGGGRPPASKRRARDETPDKTRTNRELSIRVEIARGWQAFPRRFAGYGR
jgi:hypothetical protein